MNALTEFLNHVKDRKIKCATITKGYSYSIYDETPPTFNLKINYTEEDFNNFLKNINFTYDSSYGGQEVFGTIWYMDGAWSERGEYDGSEWWEYKICPDIPESLK